MLTPLMASRKTKASSIPLVPVHLRDSKEIPLSVTPMALPATAILTLLSALMVILGAFRLIASVAAMLMLLPLTMVVPCAALTSKLPFSTTKLKRICCKVVKSLLSSSLLLTPKA